MALQYMWSSGKALTNYGFILYAATSVPLQGFWNFVVYIRPRYIKANVEAFPHLPQSMSRFSIVPRRSVAAIVSQLRVLDTIIEEETNTGVSSGLRITPIEAMSP